MNLINEKLEIRGRLFNYSAKINPFGQVQLERLSEMIYADDNLTLYAWDDKNLDIWTIDYLFEYGQILMDAQSKFFERGAGRYDRGSYKIGA